MGEGHGGEALGDGARPRLPYFPRVRVIPAKAGTYWEDRPPTRKREPTHSSDYGYEIPAYAGMTVIGALARPIDARQRAAHASPYTLKRKLTTSPSRIA